MQARKPWMHCSATGLRLALAALLLATPLGAAAAAPPRFVITKFGAKPDGATLCTAAIAKAVGAASAAVAAAGPTATAEVVVPRGRFLSGAFALATGVYLRLESGAVLLAATTTNAYPAAGWNWDPALLDTHNASRTGIVGEGTIDGQAPGLPGWVGHSPWIDHYDSTNNFLVAKTWSKVNGCQGECRPKLVRFTDCEHVTVSGVTLQNSPVRLTLSAARLLPRSLTHGACRTGRSFIAAATTCCCRTSRSLVRSCGATLTETPMIGHYCDHNLHAPDRWGNNDGVDFESGERIRVLDSTFIMGDDG